MVSISPRLRDDLEFDEPTDPRLSFGFGSTSGDSVGLEHHEDYLDDLRPLSSTPDRQAAKRDKQKRDCDVVFRDVPLFTYPTRADGHAFRIATLKAGAGQTTIECSLSWEDYRLPTLQYDCLSYCWDEGDRDASIMVDGFRFLVTPNLFAALRSLRKSSESMFIWVDQICINQDDLEEREHQVSIMKHIFNQAKKVVVWLGEDDGPCEKLCRYARKMGRGQDQAISTLNKILNPRQLQETIHRLLERAWFQRVWVVPEVALARFTVVAIGRSLLTWDNFVRLIRDVHTPQTTGFEKQTALLGNARQRIAIITQMIASQKEGKLHTDITQLLILAKSSKASDSRDKVYAFYGVTLITTVPRYKRSTTLLYIEIAEMYINSILHEDYYSSWHELTDEKRTFQLMSILYSAGALHQHKTLPSWVPDWTYAWHLAPLWAKTISNVVTGSSKDEWSSGIRGDFRAGGQAIRAFEVLKATPTVRHLRISVIVIDDIVCVGETPVSTPSDPRAGGLLIQNLVELPSLSYGRVSFATSQGLLGMATPGIRPGDRVAVLLGGDVPVVIRPCGAYDESRDAYRLLCECFVQSAPIMRGALALADCETTLVEDVVFI